MKAFIDRLVERYSGRTSFFLLESQLSRHQESRYTYFAAQPSALIKAYGHDIEIITNNKPRRFTGDPWKALRSFRQNRDDYLFGYLGYGLKDKNERVSTNNPANIDAPDLFFMVPSVLVKVDHSQNSIEVLKGKIPEWRDKQGSREDPKIANVRSNVSQEAYHANIKQGSYEV